MAKVKLVCGFCGAEVEVEVEWGGEVICPGCGGFNAVPDDPDTDDAEDPSS